MYVALHVRASRPAVDGRPSNCHQILMESHQVLVDLNQYIDGREFPESRNGASGGSSP
jgi:hypothetical protein